MNNESGSRLSQTEVLEIVIVDDIPDNLRLLVGILKERGYKVRPAPNGTRALATVRKDPPDLILLDITMPEMDGYEICRQLKADPLTSDIPVIFLSALNEVFDKIKAFQVGGVDYIVKPFQAEEVLARVSTHLTICAQQKALARQNAELIEKNALITEQAKELEKRAARDYLTGLSNRRDFYRKAEEEEIRFRRTRKPFSFILMDIDYFKRVNDTYGHECGDMVLKGVARCLEGSLRAQDIVARWGGEEFICLLPETDLDGAERVAEKTRRIIEELTHGSCGNDVKVTVTMGVSAYDGACSLDEYISRADSLLYEGKRSGRNQVVVGRG